MVRLFHLLNKGNQVLFIIWWRINSFVFAAQTCVLFMKILTVYPLSSHLLALKAYDHKMQERFFLANPNNFCSLSRANYENTYPHLMFPFTNNKIMGVWSSEMKCIKWMESNYIKMWTGINHSLVSFTSDWYHFYLSLICIDFTAK